MALLLHYFRVETPYEGGVSDESMDFEPCSWACACQQCLRSDHQPAQLRYQPADTVLDGSTRWVYIGAIRLNITGDPLPKEAWCVDLKQAVASGSWDAVQKNTIATALDDGRRADWAMGALWKNRPSAIDARGVLRYN